MSRFKFWLRILIDALSFGITYVLREKKKVKALIECIDREIKEGQKVYESVKAGTANLDIIANQFHPDNIKSRAELIQAFNGVREDIAVDLAKFKKRSK